jgi:hypothetical protein
VSEAVGRGRYLVLVVTRCNLHQAARVVLAHDVVRHLPRDAAVDGGHLRRDCTTLESSYAVALSSISAESTTCRHSAISAEATPTTRI